jgi:hypothetical protein
MNNQQKKEKSILGIVWDWIDNSRWNWANAINYRFVQYNDNIDRCAFFEELNYGWYQMYIYPYDDMYIPTISDERKKWLGELPQEYIFYVSEVDYDYIMNKIENPDPPSDALKKLFERKIPWDTK